MSTTTRRDALKTDLYSPLLSLLIPRDIRTIKHILKAHFSLVLIDNRTVCLFMT